MWGKFSWGTCLSCGSESVCDLDRHNNESLIANASFHVLGFSRFCQKFNADGLLGDVLLSIREPLGGTGRDQKGPDAR